MSYIYNVGPVESRIWSIERRQFQWPWTSLVFKVILCFDDEYLINGLRYGRGYHERRIENRTQAFEWYQFEWPSVTFLEVTIIERQIGPNSKMVQHSAIVTVADQQKVVYDLSNGAIFNDLERPLPSVLRSRHSLSLNNYLRNGTRYKVLQTQLQWNISRDLRPTQGCHFEWPWVTLNDLAKYSMTRSVARSLCDSWASCTRFILLAYFRIRVIAVNFYLQ